MKTHFASDYHFNHANIIEYCNRPFESVEQMNEELIKRWNSVVGTKDRVYYLGDLGFDKKGLPSLESIFEQLNGHKFLIKGNHDYNNKSVQKLRWAGVPTDYCEIKLSEDLIKTCLFHYPMESWNKKKHGSIHIHGHIHNTPIKPMAHRVNVSCEMWDYYPVDEDEIIKYVGLKLPL